MRRIESVIVCVIVSSALCLANDAKPLLLRKPAVSRTQIVFSYAGDLWIVGREGGESQRLTTAPGEETDPVFSPDGTQVAFTGEYDGNVDIYVVPASGGVPRRLTYHPGDDRVVGWTADGKRVLFASARDSYSGVPRLFTVPAEGGFPAEVPLPTGAEASFSPDGSHLAYVPTVQWQRAWKRYRGGQTRPIWIANLSDSSIEAKIPRDNSNDFNPMWVGDNIYFLSDRSGPVTLFAYDTKTQTVKQVVKNNGLDLKSASACPDAIVYEQFGSLHLFDLNSGQSRTLQIGVQGDFPAVRPHFVKIDPKKINAARLSPTGMRAVLETRGEILTVPAEKGDVRNITRSPAVADRDPAWSPDGKWIAYFSDESGEYALHLRDQNGMGEVRKIDLGKPPSFFYSPTWSPDSKKIAYTDKRLNLWYLDLEHPTPVHVDSDTYMANQALEPAWSPDSRWLAYTKQLHNYLHAVWVYSLEQVKSRQVTDGMSDARFAKFDPNGKYLYFTASTDVGLAASQGDMSVMDRPVTRSVYIAVLAKDMPSPLAPESDEEKVGEEKKSDGTVATGDSAKSGKDSDKEKGKEEKKPVTVKIDFEKINQRILALPVPAKNYHGLLVGKEGTLFLVEGPQVDSISFEGPPSSTVQRFDLTTRKTNKLLDGVKSFDVSHNGEKMLYWQGEQWFITAIPPAPKLGEAAPPPPQQPQGALKLDALEVYVDPRAEWKQIYHEAWRLERDFFYDPGHHGLDLNATEKKYAPYLEGVASRSDLNYLFEEMLGNMTVGHLFICCGDLPEVKKVKGGLLGADFTIENGRYRFARVFDGENWNPKLRAPLTQPGVNVNAGDYLFSVNERELRSFDEVYSFFEETAGKQVVLRVGPNPDGAGSREVTVVPVEDETGLRNLAWVEGNRRKVDELTGGRVAYVYLPDTFVDGYTNFNRYYFAQVGKQAALIDERFNGGGFLADYIIDYLRRPITSRAATREGEDLSFPMGAIYGPKVMIINEMAGSGGDALPWYFRRAGIGPLVGKRTWGGLVGWNGSAPLIDGGFVGTPQVAIYGLKGEWEVENRGIAPEYEVELDPKLVRQGHDPQLEKAVEVILDLLRKNPPPVYKRPEYPNYNK
ncbi:MAG TPA: PDZ domain-containing protein [Terriglobia bacterium]|nr:PDZ domain-containing protein [Terriglobia bacterium]